MASNPEGRTNLAVTWSLGSLATLTFAARIYTRFVFQRNAGWDDYTIILSWVRKQTEVHSILLP
jgi:hypothetical protein